jgi:predicted enzyme related to lactoylglutathione lyase
MASTFFWYELVTAEPEAAIAFYCDVIGWETQDLPTSESAYTILAVGDRGIGGVMAMPDTYREGGGGSLWLGYIHTADVDTAVARLEGAGGIVHRPSWDVPGVGRMAAVSDPEGATFMLMTPQGPDTPSVPAGTPGSVGWRELMAADAGKAGAFYGEQFGWSPAGSHDMGAMGTYRLFATGGGEADVGIMNPPPGSTSPGWRYYFTVDALDRAVGRVEAGGGTIATPPHQVPGGGWIAHCVDPQGAWFGLLSAAR